eukprot:100055_1
MRHARNRGESKTEEMNDNELSTDIIFWRDLFDNIHCYICHIYDFGYRSKTNSTESVFEKKHDHDDHTTHYVDQKFKSMQETIMKKKNVLDKLSGFSRNRINKYNINLDANIQMHEKNLTWTDGLFKYMKDNAVSQSSLQHLLIFLKQEDYDT